MFRSLCFASACLILSCLTPMSTVQADLLFFDIQGKAGFGLLAGNENHTVDGVPGSGGEMGTGIVFDNATNTLTINAGWGSANGFTNLTGDVTGAHLHGPTESPGVASFTENAGVRFNLGGTTEGFNDSGTAGGWTNTQVVLTTEDAADLLAGRFYLNVHTATNGSGEIRGNLVAIPEPSSTTLLALVGLSVVVSRRRIRQNLLAA